MGGVAVSDGGYHGLVVGEREGKRLTRKLARDIAAVRAVALLRPLLRAVRGQSLPSLRVEVVFEDSPGFVEGEQVVLRCTDVDEPGLHLPFRLYVTELTAVHEVPPSLLACVGGTNAGTHLMLAQ